MSNATTTSRRFACALLAVAATAGLHGLWLGGLDRDAAITIAAVKA